MCIFPIGVYVQSDKKCATRTVLTVRQDKPCHKELEAVLVVSLLSLIEM